jgi:hypothetical protein
VALLDLGSSKGRLIRIELEYHQLKILDLEGPKGCLICAELQYHQLIILALEGPKSIPVRSFNLM